MQKLYLFSGLGADKRMFQYFDFQGFEPVYIEWIEPKKAESIEDYAQRLRSQIKDKNPILIGLSFGGMMALEVAKWANPKKIILISSAKNYQEIPFYYRIFGKLNLHKLVAIKLLKQANFFSYWFFGAKSQEEKQLLNDILHDTNPRFLAWAIEKILNWKNTQIPENWFHIHGTSDRILPFCFIKSAIKVQNGGHFMTINQSEKINETLNRILKI